MTDLLAHRILITGSRDWDDVHAVEQALNDVVSARWHTGPHPVRFAVIDGACPTGADLIAHEWAERAQHVTSERYPADWKQYGKRAGFVRNAKMVELGADICLAFIKNESKGATMTANLAERSGIPTVRYTA